MTFLPILERELRLRARSRATYWLRFALGLVGALICLPQLLASGPFVSPATLGNYVFNGLVGMGFVLSSGACLVTCDAISAERREGTLGLLLLTRAKAFDVLVGKFGSTGFTSLCAMVAFLPVLMIPLLAGGVTGGEAVRKGLVVLNTLILSLATGLYISASTQDRFKSAWRALLLVLCFLLVPEIVGLLVREAVPGRPPVAGLASPLVSIRLAADAQYRAWFGSYWMSLLVQEVLAWLLLFGAGVRLRRAIREETSAPVTAAVLSPERPNTAARWRRWAPEHYGTRPIEWLVLRQRGLRSALWIAALLGLIPQIPIAFYASFGIGPVRSSFFSVMQLPVLGFSLVEGALFAWAASRFFVETRRTGALELLLTTPMGARTLVSGQWHALKRLLAGPVVVLVTPSLFWGFRVIFLQLGYPAWPSYYVFSSVVALVNTVLSVGAIGWLGLWFGWRARGQAGAIVWTLCLAKGVPFLIYTLSLSFMSAIVWGFIRGSVPPFTYGVVSFVPHIATLVFYFWLIRGAQRRFARALPAGMPRSFDLQESLANAKRDVAATIQKARRWTPS
jgi:ABC-type transport system involved in multi-copper enzyme maturation permease subunit